MPKSFKLDDAKQRALLRRVLDGDSVAQAARGVGCCRRTVERAAKRDTLFGRRLQTARATREELRRREEEQTAAATVVGGSLAVLFINLRRELEREWRVAAADRDADPCDFSVTRDAA